MVVWASYLVLPHRGQNVLLLAASYCFYGAWDWRFLSLIMTSTLVDFIAGRVLANTDKASRRRAALVFSLIVNLGLLGFFKYFGFFVDSAVTLLESVGLHADRPTLAIVLPVGISFYTFQTMGYTIDVFHRKLEPTRNLLDYALFVSFFPQLVAGPIERASHLLPMLQKRRVLTRDQITRGVFLILLGLMKKVAIADALAGSVGAIYGTADDISGLDVTLATYAFAFQILCDFSAYTDIARGTAKLFGIDLRNNFNAPYFAISPSDFWQRWHISLSTWLRDFLYIPLGGNRGSKLLTYRNLMLTMVLGGLWHGALWNFVLWGFYHGVLLCGFRLLSRRRVAPSSEAFPRPRRSWGRAVMRALGILVFFQITCYGWLLFRADSFQQIVSMTTDLFTFDNWLSLSMSRPKLTGLLGLMFIIPWEALTFANHKEPFYRGWHPVVRGVIVGCIIVLLVMGMNNGSSTFIYFQF